MSVHTITLETSVVALEATKAFDGLTLAERAYAHALSRADWDGAKICLIQCSVESTAIFALLQLVFAAQPVVELHAAARKELSEEEVAQAMMYAASFYANMGNYKSFGDTKFVPALPAERFELFLLSGRADAAKVRDLWSECGARSKLRLSNPRYPVRGMHRSTERHFAGSVLAAAAPAADWARRRQRHLHLLLRELRRVGRGGLRALPDVGRPLAVRLAGTEPGVSRPAERAHFARRISLHRYNTRLFKSHEAPRCYTVLLASAAAGGGDDPVGELCRKHTFDGCSFTVRRGDYAPLMGRVVKALRDAEAHAANGDQRAMLQSYQRSFELGSIEA
jgi:dipeptidyl-peptidase-3